MVDNIQCNLTEKTAGSKFQTVCVQYFFLSFVYLNPSLSNKLRGASPLRHFFVMFLVKGAERRGQWITGAQKDLTLRWLRIY